MLVELLVNDELGRIWKDTILAECCPYTCPEGRREPLTTSDWMFPDLGLNLEPPEQDIISSTVIFDCHLIGLRSFNVSSDFA
jgi:hypothetical protein